ncbi:hypothetical protein AN958_12385, partial [Leucoagaricus sp. SymC.cos]
GISLSTTTVPSADKLKIITDFISSGAKVTVTAFIPCSRSFLKVINVPFPVTPDQVTPMLNNSGLEIDLTTKPHVMCNLQHSDTATIWFDIWDSQSGASAKKLKNQHVSINNAHYLIQLAKAHPGTPQCQ